MYVSVCAITSVYFVCMYVGDVSIMCVGDVSIMCVRVCVRMCDTSVIPNFVSFRFKGILYPSVTTLNVNVLVYKTCQDNFVIQHFIDW